MNNEEELSTVSVEMQIKTLRGENVLLREENQSLRNDNEMLVGCVLELSGIIYGGDLSGSDVMGESNNAEQEEI